jgi:hypothetical protein
MEGAGVALATVAAAEAAGAGGDEQAATRTATTARQAAPLVRSGDALTPAISGRA